MSLEKFTFGIFIAVTLLISPSVQAVGNIEKETDLAAAAYQAGDYQQAIEHFRKVVKASPKDAMAWHFLGQSLAKTGDRAGAKEAYERVLQLQPNGDIAKRTRDLLAKLNTFRDCPECPEMVIIPAGSFDMGSNDGEPNERPVHRVTIAKSFAMSKYEITQGQWKAIMGNNPSHFQNCGDDCPVEEVSYMDAYMFTGSLKDKTGKNYNLPSESEWEYACRAGGHHKYCGSDDADSVAWFFDGGATTHSVGLKKPNAFGLYDMSGNVAEWVLDWTNDDYNSAPADGTARYCCAPTERILRGGAWLVSNPKFMRATARRSFNNVRSENSGLNGFRVVRELP